MGDNSSRPPTIPLSREEVLRSYEEDQQNAFEADTAIEVARWGHYCNLANRLRNLAKLTIGERQLIANILDDVDPASRELRNSGKYKLKHRLIGRPSSLIKRGEQTAIARKIALLELTKTAKPTGDKSVKTKRTKTFNAIAVVGRRIPAVAKARGLRKKK